MKYPTIYRIIGIILLLLGAVIRVWINKRKFYRRSMTGREWFPTYTIYLLARIIEGALYLISLALIIAGGYLLIMTYL